MKPITPRQFVPLLLAIGASFVCNAAIASHIDAEQIKNPLFINAYKLYQQGQQFEAMAMLMAADKQNRLGDDRQLGQLFMAQNFTELGLHKEAIRIYEQIAKQPKIKQKFRDIAWLESAKLHLQQGRFETTLTSLANIKQRLDKEQEADFKAAKSRALLETEKLKETLATLPRISDDSIWALYQLFNIGELLIDEHRNKNGAMILHHIGKLDTDENSEVEAIKDQANLALGFSLLKIKKPKKARKYLEQVRLKSHLSNIALLGMGWSYSIEDNNEQALVFWMELNNKTNRSAYGYETLLAVPYALGKANAYNQAIQHYKTAQKQIDADIDAMDEAKKKINSSDFARLISSKPDQETSWLSTWQNSPESPQNRLLPLLLDSPEFQSTLMEYRTLLQLKQHIHSLDDDIKQLKTLDSAQTSGDADTFQTRQQQLTAQIDNAIQQQFATLKQLALTTLDRYKAQLNTYSDQIRFGIAQAIEGGTFKAEEGL